MRALLSVAFAVALSRSVSGQAPSAVVDSAKLHAAGATSPAAAMAGKVAGVRVVTLSGAPGARPSLVFRAASSYALSAPLVVVDGVVSRLPLGDINVDDVERIELLKGAAAASIYGVEAANGVIHVITKRSRDTLSAFDVVTVRSEVSRERLPRLVPISMHHAFQLNAAGDAFVLDASGNRIVEPDSINDNAYPVLHDPADALLGSGLLLSNHLSVHHRRDGWFGLGDYYGSLHHERDEGVVSTLRGFSRKGLRFNLDRSLSESFHLDGGLYYTSSSTDLPEPSGDHIGALRWIEPSANLDSMVNSGLCVGASRCHVSTVPAGRFGPLTNPLYAIESTDFSDERSRFAGSLNANYRIREWLALRAGFSGQSGEDHLEVFPNGSRTLISRRDDTHKASTTSVMLASVRSLRRGTIRNSSWIGFINERTSFSSDELAPAASTSVQLNARTLSQVLSTTFELNGRATIDASVRRDDPSTITDYNPVYHSVRVAYHPPGPLTVRAAMGTAGLPLPFEAELLAPIGSGITLLRPPYVRETEYAVNARLRRGIRLEYVSARQRLMGYPLPVPTPASTGFTIAWRNVGIVSGRTHEATLGIPLVSRPNLSWRADIVAHRTRSVMTRLDFPDFLMGPYGAFWMRTGEELGTLYGTRWIRSDAQLAETIFSGQLAGPATDYVRNEEGYFVRVADHRTTRERPLPFFECTQTDAAGACTASNNLVPLGQVTPDVEFGATNRVQFRGLSLSATVSGAAGGLVFDYARRVAFITWRDAVYDQSAKPSVERKPGPYYAGFANSAFGTVSDYFVESAAHVKLRELALDWTVPTRMLAATRIKTLDVTSIGLVARNLWTFSGYDGHDPDVAAASASVFDYHVDVFQHPAYRTLGIRLKAVF